MKLSLEIMKAILNKVRGYDNGTVIKELCENMG